MKKTGLTKKRNAIIYFLLLLVVVTALLFFKTTNKYIIGIFGIAIYGALPALILLSVLLLLGKKVKVGTRKLFVYAALLFCAILTLHVLFSKNIYSKDFFAVVSNTIERETVGGVLASVFTYIFFLMFNYQITLLIFFLATSILGIFVLYPLFLSRTPQKEKKERFREKYIEEDKSIYIENINTNSYHYSKKKNYEPEEIDTDEAQYKDSVNILFGSGKPKQKHQEKKEEKYFEKLGYKNYKEETSLGAKNKILGEVYKEDYYRQKYENLPYSNPLTNKEYVVETPNQPTESFTDSNNEYKDKFRDDFIPIEKEEKFKNSRFSDKENLINDDKEEYHYDEVNDIEIENKKSRLFGNMDYNDYYGKSEVPKDEFVINNEVIENYDQTVLDLEEKPSTYIYNTPKKDNHNDYSKNESSFKEHYYQEPKPKKPVKKNNKFVFPPLDLLEYSDNNSDDMIENYHFYKEKIENTYSEFNIKVEVTKAMRGPSFTRYELKLAPGIQLSRVVSVKNNLEMRLSAGNIRILAPIPKKDAIGIEIPNKKRETVSLKTMLISQQFQNSKGGIMIALGKTLEGESFSVDLAKLPHLLIAGATGTGKSVCINCLILSILYKYTPDEVRLILIDPKKVELSPFRRLPHLLISETVTEPQQAINTLKWLTEEMDNRYRIFQGKCNNIEEYNKICDTNGEKRMHKIVLVVDEMADLMVKSKATVETYLVRLAQLARAAGIHLILATQRPTVNVITGLIKSNILARIAFTVKNGADSRIILDEMGAENLLKMGDMLYSYNNDTLRIQGAFVSNEERAKVATFIKENNDSDFDQEVEDIIMGNNEEDEVSAVTSNVVSKQENTFDLDSTAINVLRTFVREKKASTSMAQAKNGVGYIRATKIVNEFEKRGYIGGADGSKPRQVFMTEEEFMNKFGEYIDD